MALPPYPDCPYRAGDLVVIVQAKDADAPLESGDYVLATEWDVNHYTDWVYVVRRAEPHEEAAWRLRVAR